MQQNRTKSVIEEIEEAEAEEKISGIIEIKRKQIHFHRVCGNTPDPPG